MTRLAFVIWVTALTVLTGVAEDLVTANMAVEYFTVHHPRVVESDSPWVMALVWGFSASWWFGLPAGFALDWFDVRRGQQVGRLNLLRWVRNGLAGIWFAMMAIVVGVYKIALLVPMHQRRPSFEHDRRLMAVAMAHQFEYLFGAIVVAVLLIKIARYKSAEA